MLEQEEVFAPTQKRSSLCYKIRWKRSHSGQNLHRCSNVPNSFA